MRRTVIASLCLLCSLGFHLPGRASGSLPSTFAATDTVTVHNSIRAYFDAICRMPVDSVISRCDVLIESPQDDGTRASIAGLAYDYFANSPIMGIEAVAVHIADKWFLSKTLQWPYPETYPLLYTYAEFNRQSLVGRPAPALILENEWGQKIDLRGNDGIGIIYFYDSQCATCARETPLLTSFLNGYDGAEGITLYAVFTQSDRAAWESYRRENFDSIVNPRVIVHNLWDPEGESSFHLKYGVLSTPMMLMTDRDHRIAGRKLDAEALAVLLERDGSFTARLFSLMDNLVENVGCDTLAVRDFCSAFERSAQGDSTLLRDSFLGIYNYLHSSESSDACTSADWVARNHIVGRADLWSEETISRFEAQCALFEKNMPGTRAADATLYNHRGKSVRLLSHKGKGGTVIFFNLVQCSRCQSYKQQLEALDDLLKKNKVKLVSVYVGPDRDEWLESIGNAPRSWRNLRAEWPDSDIYNLYDLSIVPRIYHIDRRGKVIARNISPEDLETALKQTRL